MCFSVQCVFVFLFFFFMIFVDCSLIVCWLLLMFDDFRWSGIARWRLDLVLVSTSVSRKLAPTHVLALRSAFSLVSLTHEAFCQAEACKVAKHESMVFVAWERAEKHISCSMLGGSRLGGCTATKPQHDIHRKTLCNLTAASFVRSGRVRRAFMDGVFRWNTIKQRALEICQGAATKVPRWPLFHQGRVRSRVCGDRLRKSVPNTSHNAAVSRNWNCFAKPARPIFGTLVGNKGGSCRKCLWFVLCFFLFCLFFIFCFLLISVDFYWFSLIFIDVRWFPLIFLDFCWFSLVFMYFLWFSLIFIYFRWLFVDCCWLLFFLVFVEVVDEWWESGGKVGMEKVWRFLHWRPTSGEWMLCIFDFGPFWPRPLPIFNACLTRPFSSLCP